MVSCSATRFACMELRLPNPDASWGLYQRQGAQIAALVFSVRLPTSTSHTLHMVCITVIEIGHYLPQRLKRRSQDLLWLRSWLRSVSGGYQITWEPKANAVTLIMPAAETNNAQVEQCLPGDNRQAIELRFSDKLRNRPPFDVQKSILPLIQ